MLRLWDIPLCSLHVLASSLATVTDGKIKRTNRSGKLVWIAFLPTLHCEPNVECYDKYFSLLSNTWLSVRLVCSIQFPQWHDSINVNLHLLLTTKLEFINIFPWNCTMWLPWQQSIWHAFNMHTFSVSENVQLYRVVVQRCTGSSEHHRIQTHGWCCKATIN